MRKDEISQVSTEGPNNINSIVGKENAAQQDTGAADGQKAETVRPDGRINETLLELLAGIAGFALVCQAAGVWFVTDRAGFSIGLWLGALMAALAAYHMWRTLDRALELEESAPRVIQKNSILRYAVIVVVLGVIMVTQACNPLAAFLGLMGLKVSAYLQPFTHRLRSSKKKH